ncbi:MAG: hypothetical protein AAF236_08095, partial [Verrucomicrobiota bacterium]
MSGSLFSANADSHPILRWKDDGSALYNPGREFVFYDKTLRSCGRQLSDDYGSDTLPGFSVCYLRIGWAYIEPT